VTTKSGPGLKDIPTSFDESLKKLGLHDVNLFLIHWPYDFPKPGYPTIEEAWKQMEAIKDSGRAKSIGVSNFRIRDLEKIMNMPGLKHKPTVNQIEFHPFMYEAGEELYQYREWKRTQRLLYSFLKKTVSDRIVTLTVKKHDIKIAAYGPTTPLTKFANDGFLAALDKAAQGLAARSGQSKVEPGQVLLRLAAQRGAIVITTSGKEFRMKEQLAAGALPELTQEEVEALVAAAKPAPQRAFMKHMDDQNTEY
jgi:diketogulonate reductase-like aldo/keto reductase